MRVQRIGVSGHQHRDGADWAWVRDQINAALDAHGPFGEGLSCLAVGADQLFAQACLEHGVPHTAIIPMVDYDRFFEGPDLVAYRDLRARSQEICLLGDADDEQAFRKAGRYVVDHCDLLLVVWDGKPAAGPGGAGDIADYAILTGRPFLHLDPINRTLLPPA